ncbi:hypothetical protein Pfo_022065 [Paulownia fortunei]|nr:hypothetical protein Pfo_022065 [Paulownia fortunei]
MAEGAMSEVKSSGSRMLVVRSHNPNLQGEFLEKIARNRAAGDDELVAGADFRPTTSGHSPGVGHATGPSSRGPKI